MKTKKILSALLAGACVFGMSAAMSSSVSAEEMIKVGVFLPLTGDNAAGGELELRGIKLANEQHNKVLGKKIQLVVQDNKSDKAEAANVVARLIEKDKVCAVVGTYGSSLAMAAGNILKENKIPAVGTSCTNPQVTKGNDYYFRACFIDPFQGSVMAKFAAENKGTKKVAIYMDKSSDYAKGLAANFEKTLVAMGGKIVANEAYLAKDVDFKAALTRLKAANPEAIYVPGYYEEVSKIIKQARELGITVPMYGCDGWESPVLAEIAGKAALKNCFYVSAFSADDPDPSIKAFMDAYKAFKGEPGDVFVQQGYNAGKVLFAAMEKAGKGAKGVDIAKAMAATKDLPIAGGTLTYDANHNPVMPGLIIDLSSGSAKLAAKVNM